MSQTFGVVELKKGKERKIANFYPWVQKGECRSLGAENGLLARLVDSEGRFLAIGTYNGQSRFQFRVLSYVDEPIDEEFFATRFRKAIELRDQLISGTNGRRVVYSEADLLPGLIADQFGDHVVLQVRSLGMENLKHLWIGPLQEAAKAKTIYEKSEMAGRNEEGLSSFSGLLHGNALPEITVEEDGLVFPVPVQSGLKTGFYLDQRETRRRFEQRIKPGEKVLDCFSYTGSFCLRAARAGAQVYGIDIHQPAIEVARDASTRNGLEAVFWQANAFEYLLEDSLEPYDWIVLDPPAIAKTSEKRDALKWAVWKLVHAAIPKLKPGGRLIVCSCSYQLDLKELIETARLAASDNHKRIFFEDVTYQDLDHPAPLQFPEALYLKCAWLRVH